MEYTFQPLEYYNLTMELALHNHRRLEPGSTVGEHPRELEYIEGLRSVIQDSLPKAPTMYDFNRLLITGPGQGDPLFPWLAKKATLPQMKWFLTQEEAGEAGFGDLTAMVSVRMPNQVKLEMARNYWDEMGNGRESAMHDKLLRDLASKLKLNHTVEDTMPEALQLANIMTLLCIHRRYAYLALGALGVIEMTAPGRVDQVAQGLKRLGVSKKDRTYFELHAVLDLKHSREWNKEVIEPLAAEHMDEMYEGAYLRLWAGSRCFDRYRDVLGVA